MANHKWLALFLVHTEVAPKTKDNNEQEEEKPLDSKGERNRYKRARQIVKILSEEFRYIFILYYIPCLILQNFL